MDHPTVAEVLKKTTTQLNHISDTAHLDAELLLTLVMNHTKEYLLAHPEQLLTSQQQVYLQKLISRRINGEPIAYILGHKEFWSLDLMVTPDVLIPRPETEHLIEWALTHLPKNIPLNLADLGVGSGAIALALAKEFPLARIDGTEKNPNAIKIAKQNAAKHDLLNVNFFIGNWCESLPRKDYTAIFANPPYIAHDDAHFLKLKYEPQDALDGGKEGLDAIKEIIFSAYRYLKPNSFLILEHGYDQESKVVNLLNQAGYSNIQDHQDLAGLPRFVTAIRGSELQLQHN